MSVARRLAIATLAAAVVIPVSARAGTFTTLYTFTGGADGGYPQGQLINQNGALYGVTNAVNVNGSQFGNVFKFDPKTQSLTVLYDFKGGIDGNDPNDLIYHGGIFYGTTILGGANGEGTVFDLNARTGRETILYSFPNPGNGNTPFPGGLIYESGMLYGTTIALGNNLDGSVFAINPNTGVATTVFSFNGADGIDVNPYLVFNNGFLYGTTLTGGPNSCTLHNTPVGCGVVFGVNLSTGAESTIYSFTEGADGFAPYSNLIYDNGLLYGATLLGGDMSCHHDGCGALYSVSIQTGSEEVLTTNRVKGSQGEPANITDHGASIYEAFPGTGRDLGELVKFDLRSGHKTVLHKFTNGSDGSRPLAPLTYNGGVYYGTTFFGGNSGCDDKSGCGTIFEYVP
jgi:uncharacterized repeat protein (TIGR03803 family)